MKKLLVFMLAALMLFSLCACGQTQSASKDTPAESAATAEPAPAAPEVSAAPAANSVEGQLNLIYNHLTQLHSNAEYSKFYYTITDLDHNGRLEVFAAVTEGNNAYTRGDMYEISSDYASLTQVQLGAAATDGLPEVIVRSTDTYASGSSYSYVYTDTSSVGAPGHYITVQALSLQNGTLESTLIGYQDVETINGYTVYTFSDANGNILSNPDDFPKLTENKFSGAAKSTTNFDWFSLSDVTSVSRLATSYNVFAGNAVAPVATATPAPVYTPAPTTYIVETNPVITKNPTNENRYVGETAYFVAQATGYQSMLWKFVDPYGNIYNANRVSFAYSVSGVDTPQLTISNVTTDMNGWSAYAEFYGKTTVTTSRATLYVTQRPVETAYVYASPSSGSYFCDLYNTVCLTSSNGQNIHYECIKSGDSGAYASGEVGNYGCISVDGIEGQYITVEVYANVVGSDNVCYFTYTVDRTPTPVPTPDPGPQCVTGTIGPIETMNSVPIIINGGTYWTTRDSIQPQGAELSQGSLCTVWYSGSYDNIISVIVGLDY